jgi:hypothetical protein
VGEPEAVAPLDHLVATRPTGEVAGRGAPVRGPRSQSCSSRRRSPLHRAEPPASSSPCCSPASARTTLSPVLHPPSPSASTPPRHRILGPEVSTTFPSSLWSLAFVPSREKRAKPVVSSVPFLDRCPSPRRRAVPPSSESRPSSRVGRMQVPLPSSPRALLCLAVVSFLCSTCIAELRFSAGPHTLSTPPSSEGPAFLWPGVV